MPRIALLIVKEEKAVYPVVSNFFAKFAIGIPSPIALKNEARPWPEPVS